MFQKCFKIIFENKISKIKLIPFLLIFILMNNKISTAQDENCRQANNPKAIEMYNSAVKKIEYNPKSAEELLLQTIKISPFYTDAYFSLAELYYNQAVKSGTEKKDIAETASVYENSSKYFEKVIEICQKYNSYMAFYYLAKINFQIKKYKESKTNSESFIADTKKEKEKAEIQTLLKNINEYLTLIENPVAFKPERLTKVSTADDEYLPFLSPDGDNLFFTRRINSPKNKDDFKELFSLSQRTSKKGDPVEIFSVGEPMPPPFNDGRNQGGATVTVDNRQLFLTVCGIDKNSHYSYKNCDIYYSEKEKNKWGQLTRLGNEINDNSSFEGQPSVTSDGKFLYFAGAKPGGFGGLDIYRSERNSDGTWKKAENLGSVINTSGDEKTPFIHPDGKTLYFASNGHSGMGGFDIFVSRYDEKNGWSKPQNIGYPINTENDELAFVVSTDGTKIYFSSNTLNEKSNWDIYSCGVPESAKPTQVLLVKGRISGEDGDTIAKVKVKVTGIHSKKTTNGFVDNNTGDYAVTVPVELNEKYVFTAQKKGYFYQSLFIDPLKHEYIPPTLKDFKVKKIAPNIPFRLNNVNFAFDSYKINDTAMVELSTLSDFLKDNSDKRIEIRGHTDNIGTPEHNLELSQNRANAVKNYLIKKGILPSRMVAKGFGETVPLTTNDTEKGRAINRRVEMIFLN
jgi:outer membrane protein OmpA-like peptidoglycan-associated protein